MTHPLDFAINVNALGAPACIRTELTRLGESLVLDYPDHELKESRIAVERLFGVSRDLVTVTIGATEGIFALLRLFAPKRVAVFSPSFWEYTVFSERAGAEVAAFVDEAIYFNPASDAVLEHVRRGDVAFLGNPNNPTGQLLTRAEIEVFAREAPNTEIIVDETYLPFRSDYASRTVLPLLSTFPNLTVVTSLSKVFGVPGVRLGFVATRPERAKQLALHTVPYGVGRPAEIVLSLLAGDRAFLDRTRAFYDEERVHFARELHEHVRASLRPLSWDANFVFGELVDGSDSRRLTADLAARGIVVRGGHEFGPRYERHVRFAIKRREENRRLLEELARRQGRHAHFSAHDTVSSSL